MDIHLHIPAFLLGWSLPLVLTIIFLFMMFRPTKKTKYNGPAAGMGLAMLLDGVEGFFRIFWLFPILITWLVYLIVK